MAESSSLRIQVLGRVAVWRDGDEVGLGVPQRRAILGLLALAGGQPVATSELIAALWGEQPPTSAVNLIQTHIKHLRKLLDPGRKTRTPSDVLPRVGDGYALRVPADAVDLARFRSLVSDAATDHREGGDPRRAGAR